MAKLTTYIVAAALSGAAITGAVVATQSNKSDSSNYEAPAQQQMLIQQAVAPAVVPQNSFSGGTTGAQTSDAVIVPISSSSSIGSNNTGASPKSAVKAQMAQTANVYSNDNSDDTFSPSASRTGSLEGSTGITSMTMALNTNRMVSTQGTGFVGISRSNSAQQQGLFASAGASTTAPPPPGNPDPKDQLPLTGNLLALLTCILAYAGIKKITRFWE